jgi:hypothetical protein
MADSTDPLADALEDTSTGAADNPQPDEEAIAAELELVEAIAGAGGGPVWDGETDDNPEPKAT